MIKTLDDISVSNKKVILRLDINVPMVDGVVTDDTRIRNILPTLNELVQKKASVIIIAHFGRPKGKNDPKLSLEPIAKYISRTSGLNIDFVDDIIGEKAKQAAASLKSGQILMLENIRFISGEEKNDVDFACSLAQMADIYMNDAFSVSHRAHSSTHAITRFLPSIVGRSMQGELEALDKALKTPKRPVSAVVGGAKVSTKITLLENLLNKVDLLVIGGGMANTFLAARGYNVGKSLCEYDYISTAKKIMERALSQGKQIILPTDVVVSKEFAQNADCRTCHPSEITEDEMILDAGEQTIKLLRQTFASMKTIVWNGPLGAFEIMPFDKSTVEAARIVAELTQKGIVTSIAGGGDTVSALNHAGVSEKFSYVSTAGGAFLEWMEGKELPAVAVLQSQEETV